MPTQTCLRRTLRRQVLQEANGRSEAARFDENANAKRRRALHVARGARVAEQCDVFESWIIQAQLLNDIETVDLRPMDVNENDPRARLLPIGNEVKVIEQLRGPLEADEGQTDISTQVKPRDELELGTVAVHEHHCARRPAPPCARQRPDRDAR